ncbi:MAG: winged helix-turn-helix domain-containing protein [Myxococcota bacterium]
MELRRRDRSIEIQRRPLELLLYLVRHRDRIVSREELLAALWPGTQVSDGALSTAIYTVRRALEEEERHPPWVRTVRGRGLRYEGPCEAPGAELRSGDAIPLLARDAALAALRDAAAAAARGRGSAVFVIAPAGLGKTRLLRDFLDELAGFRAIEARAEPELLESPNALWSEVLQTWAGDPAGIADDLPLAELHRRVAALIRSGDPASPIVLVLEDLHWAHPASLSVVASALPRLARAGVLLVGTFRPGGNDVSAARLAGLVHQPGVQRVELEPFGVREVYEVLGLVRGRTASQAEVAEVLRRSEGVPLYVIQLAHQPTTDGGRRAGNVLTDTLMQHAPEVQRMLGVAALVGSTFELEQVDAALGLQVASDRQWTSDALRDGLIERDASSLSTFRFSHNLIREAAANGLEATERVGVHARLAMMLERRWPEPTSEQMRTLARHYAACAEDPIQLERAIHWDLQVARSAAARHAWEDVCEATSRLRGWLERSGPRSSAQAHRPEVLSHHAAALAALPRRLPELQSTMREIEALPETADLEERARRFAHAALCAHFAGEVTRALPPLAALAEIPDERVRFLSAALSILTDVQSGRYREAFDAAKAILSDAGPPTRDLLPTYEAADVCMAYGALAGMMLGDADAARTLLAAAEERAARRGDAFSQAMVIFTTCVALDLAEDWAALADTATRLDPLCLEFDVRRFLGSGYAFGCLARARLGATGEPLEGTAQVVRTRAARSEGTSFRPYILGFAATLFTHAGTPDAARACYREASACGHAGEVGFAPALLLREAEALSGWGEPELAMRRLDEAEALAIRLAASGIRERLLGLRERLGLGGGPKS